jgi:hypothetical protein
LPANHVWWGTTEFTRPIIGTILVVILVIVAILFFVRRR